MDRDLQYLKKLYVCLPFDPAIPLLGIYPENTPPSLCPATGGATIVKGPRTAMKSGPRTAMRSGPRLPQLEKALARTGPNTVKNK